MVKPVDASVFSRSEQGVGEFGDCDPRIHYFVRGDPVQNFGDYLPEIFCKELLTFPKVEADVYRLVGSVIEPRWIDWDLSRANGTPRGSIAFWGCGVRNDAPLAPRVRAKCSFFGVRGPLTRDVLGLPAETVLGDPGLLAPLFHTPRPHPETDGKIICLPHVQDPKPVAEALAMAGADVAVSPEIEASEAALRTLLDKIASARFVLTASLHGAIIACAYGRPFAFWDNGHVDAPFKWRDFAASIGAPCVFAKTAAEGQALWSRQVGPAITRLPLTPMLQVCPFGVRPSVLLRALALDGQLDPRTAATAAAALQPLDEAGEAARLAVQAMSAQTRSGQHGVRAQLERGAGRGVRRLARRLPRGAKLFLRR